MSEQTVHAYGVRRDDKLFRRARCGYRPPERLSGDLLLFDPDTDKRMCPECRKYLHPIDVLYRKALLEIVEAEDRKILALLKR
jgi:hypothetical protein